jgi:phage terminase large subunit
LGDPDAGIKPTLFIHPRCGKLIACLPFLQHDPDRPGDVLKMNINEEGLGGDDLADALRYLVATRANRIYAVKLKGL